MVPFDLLFTKAVSKWGGAAEEIRCVFYDN